MLNTSDWPELTLGVLKEVRLDPANVRLESSDSQVEADIIEDLFANEAVIDLVEGISSIGYLTHEIPIAIRKNDQYIIVEGNRRLAALKAIQNPMLVPDYKAQIERFSERIPDKGALSKIRVMIAPNRDEADRLIAAIHTSNLRKPWSPARQAAFFQAQIDSGRNLPELLSRYPTIKVRRFVFSAHVLNLFKNVTYPEKRLQDFLDSKKGRKGLSALARIYESKEFLDLTGLRMDEDGQVTKSISDQIFTSMAAVIIEGMVEGNIDTRSLNSVKGPRYAQLMGQLKSIAAEDIHDQPVQTGPDPKEQVSVTPKPAPAKKPTLFEKEGSKKETKTETPQDHSTPGVGIKSVPQRKKKQTSLDLSQVKVPPQYPDALKALLGELSEINIQKFPNATFIMLRAVLERSIKAYAEQKQEEIRRVGTDGKGYVQLNHALKWLLEDVKKSGPKFLVQVINGVISSKITYNASQDSFNAINHNHHFSVDPDQVIEAWRSISSIVRHVMKP